MNFAWRGNPRNLALCGSLECPVGSMDLSCRHCIQEQNVHAEQLQTNVGVQDCLPSNILQLMNIPPNSSEWLLTIQYEAATTTNEPVSTSIDRYLALTLLAQYLQSSTCPKVQAVRDSNLRRRVLSSSNTTFLTGASLNPDYDVVDTGTSINKNEEINFTCHAC